MSLSAPCTTLCRGSPVSKGRGLYPHPSVSPASGPEVACRCAQSVRPVAACSSRSLRALRLDVLEGDAVYSRSTIVLLGHLIRYAQGLHILQTWTRGPQKRQDGSAFALTYILRLRSCKSMRRLCHLVLAFPVFQASQMAGPLRFADIAPLQRYYGPSRHPLVFGRLPRFRRLCRAYLAPAISRWDERSFSSCSACPRHRAVASTPPR